MRKLFLLLTLYLFCAQLFAITGINYFYYTGTNTAGDACSIDINGTKLCQGIATANATANAGCIISKTGEKMPAKQLVDVLSKFENGAVFGEKIDFNTTFYATEKPETLYNNFKNSPNYPCFKNNPTSDVYCICPPVELFSSALPFSSNDRIVSVKNNCDYAVSIGQISGATFDASGKAAGKNPNPPAASCPSNPGNDVKCLTGDGSVKSCISDDASYFQKDTTSNNYYWNSLRPKDHSTYSGPVLLSGQSVDLLMPQIGMFLGCDGAAPPIAQWSGSIYGRTCYNKNTGKFAEQSSDCQAGDSDWVQTASCFKDDKNNIASWNEECFSPRGPQGPLTSAEATFQSSTSVDYYDLTVISGFTVPMGINPKNHIPDLSKINYSCGATGFYDADTWNVDSDQVQNRKIWEYYGLTGQSAPKGGSLGINDKGYYLSSDGILVPAQVGESPEVLGYFSLNGMCSTQGLDNNHNYPGAVTQLCGQTPNVALCKSAPRWGANSELDSCYVPPNSTSPASCCGCTNWPWLSPDKPGDICVETRPSSLKPGTPYANSIWNSSIEPFHDATGSVSNTGYLYPLKKAVGSAYTYPYDDPYSTFTCLGINLQKTSNQMPVITNPTYPKYNATYKDAYQFTAINNQGYDITFCPKDAAPEKTCSTTATTTLSIAANPSSVKTSEPFQVDYTLTINNSNQSCFLEEPLKVNITETDSAKKLIKSADFKCETTSNTNPPITITKTCSGTMSSNTDGTYAIRGSMTINWTDSPSITNTTYSQNKNITVGSVQPPTNQLTFKIANNRRAGFVNVFDVLPNINYAFCQVTLKDGTQLSKDDKAPWEFPVSPKITQGCDDLIGGYVICGTSDHLTYKGSITNNNCSYV